MSEATYALGYSPAEIQRLKNQGAMLRPITERLLRNAGGMIVSPTKVGYIIMTSDADGLKRRFTAKQRALNKPGVVLCGSMEQVGELAEMNDAIEAVYQKAGDGNALRRHPLSGSRRNLRTAPEAAL